MSVLVQPVPPYIFSETVAEQLVIMSRESMPFKYIEEFLYDAKKIAITSGLTVSEAKQAITVAQEIAEKKLKVERMKQLLTISRRSYEDKMLEERLALLR